MLKKSISFILSFIIVLSLFITVPFSASAAVAVDKNTFLLENKVQSYFYSDSYFSRPGSIENEHLRTLSAVLSFSVASVYDDQDISSLFSDIGFYDIETWDLETTSPDTVGTVIAQKNIGGKPVVAVALRSDGYQREWASNVLCGETGDAEGFSKSASTVESRLKEYIYNKGMKSAKVWVMGYSRGGAVANLLGADLNEAPSDFATSKDDIYIYTFECPRAALTSVEYPNIFNTVDDNDIVTAVYPMTWDLNRHGLTGIIGDSDKKIMIKSFSFFDSSHMTDVGEYDQSDYISELMTFFAANVSRKDYADNIQPYLYTLCDLIFGLDSDEFNVFTDFVKLAGDNIMSDSQLLSKALPLLSGSTDDSVIDPFVELVLNNAEKARDAMDPTVDDELYKALCSSVKPLIKALLPVVHADLNSKITIDGREQSAPIYHLITLAANFSDLIETHYNESVFKYLMEADSYYSRKDEALVGDSDMDGSVTVNDPTLIQKSLNNYCKLSENEEYLSDVDKDSDVTVIDASYIQKYISDLQTVKSIGKTVIFD